MDNKYFLLGTIESNRIVNLLRIVFGIVCLVVAVFWLIFNIQSIKADMTLWITIIFLTLFGSYQIWSGFGRAIRFIEIGKAKIRLRNNPFLPAKDITNEDIEKIEIFPLNVIFFRKGQKRILLRFGTVHYETNEKIIDEIIHFADFNKISYEIIEEEL